MTTVAKQRRFEQWCLEHHTSADELQEEAARVRDIYVRFRRHLFPYYRVNKAKHPLRFWGKVVMKLIDEKLDPLEYISLCFNIHGALTSPEVLLRAKSKVFYTQHHDARLRQVSEFMRLYSQKLSTLLEQEPNRTVRDILTDPCSNFGDVFVWCIARHHGLPDIVAQYEPRARLFLQDPIVMKVYRDAFPGVINA
jgi:hypothetical protein